MSVHIKNEERIYTFIILGKHVQVAIQANHAPGIDPIDALILELSVVLEELKNGQKARIENGNKEFKLPPVKDDSSTN